MVKLWLGGYYKVIAERGDLVDELVGKSMPSLIKQKINIFALIPDNMHTSYKHQFVYKFVLGQKILMKVFAEANFLILILYKRNYVYIKGEDLIMSTRRVWK